MPTSRAFPYFLVYCNNVLQLFAYRIRHVDHHKLNSIIPFTCHFRWENICIFVFDHMKREARDKNERWKPNRHIEVSTAIRRCKISVAYFVFLSVHSRQNKVPRNLDCTVVFYCLCFSVSLALERACFILLSSIWFSVLCVCVFFLANFKLEIVLHLTHWLWSFVFVVFLSHFQANGKGRLQGNEFNSELNRMQCIAKRQNRKECKCFTTVFSPELSWAANAHAREFSATYAYIGNII